MRPIKLVIEGLRSYRKRQEISFEGVGLFAITGRTGAGKSSILEAMLLALYHASTFDQRNVKALIADGADDLLVSLQFEVHKQRWQITRTVSRTSRASIHELRSLDGRTTLDKKAEVDARIVELLGLSCDDFLKTVVLPQGQFQSLLQSSPADRAPLLKSLLGLDELDRMSEQLEKLREQMSSAVLTGRGRRQALPADPEQELELAQRELEEGRIREATAVARWEQARGLEQQRSLTETALHQVRGQLEQLSRLPLPDPGLLEAIEAREAEIRAQELELEAEAERLAERSQALSQEGFPQLGQARSVFQQLQQWSARCQELVLSEAVEAAAARALEQDVSGLELQIEAGARELAELEQAGRQAAQESEVARQTLTRASQLQQEIERQRKELENWEKSRSQRLRVSSDLAAELTALHQQVAARREESSQARERLRQAERENLVAALCEGHEASAGCPVCQQSLPADWAPPSGGDLERSRHGHEELEKRLQELLGQSQRLEGRLNSEQHELNGLSERCQEGQTLLGGLLQGVPDSLAELNAAWRQLEQACLELREAYTQRRGELERARALHQERRKGAQQAEARAQSQGEERQRLEARVAESQVELSSLLELESFEASAVLTRLDGLEARARAADSERALLLQAMARVQSQRGQLAQRRQLEVDQPRAEQRSRRLALGVLLDALDGPDSETDLTRRRQEAEGRRHQEVARLEAGRADWLCRWEALLQGGSLLALEQAATEARERRALREERRQLAEQARERCRQLDVALKPVERMMGQLTTLHEALGNRRGKGRLSFSQWLLEQRQQELLSIASRLFGEMTANQYGFSAQFQVVDRGSGQARKPNTLSGGESFLASLALALALSELVGRKGGRLEAFFLDEGFGSLSPDALDRALDALEALALSGRMIGVISHVGLIAERIQRVWQVKRGPEGSSIEDLQPDQRQQLARVGLDQFDAELHPLLAG